MTVATAVPSSHPGSGAGVRRRSGTLTMVRYGLHAHRWAFSGVSALGFISTYSTGASYAAAAGTGAARIAFGHQITTLGTQIAYLVPLPLHPETIAGYVWWKGLTYMTLVFAAWGLAAATGMVRNEEDRGLMETWLAAPLGRLRLLLARLTAFTVAALGAAAITGVGVVAGVASGKSSVGAGAVVEQCLPLLGIALVCLGIGLAVAQVWVTRRAALGAGTAVLLALYILDALARVNPGLDGWAVISPFHLVDITTAMVPGGRFDGAATGSLFAIAVVLLVLTGWSFRSRDLLGSVLGGRRVSTTRGRTASASRALRVPVLSRLWQQRLGLAAWLVGVVALGAFMASAAVATGKLLKSIAGFQRFLQSTGTNDASVAVVSSIWFGMAGLLVAAYSIVQISRWAADDAEGRLEMEIAQPLPRWRVVAERAATLAIGAALIIAVGSLVVAILLPAQGIHIATGPMVVATVLLLPLALTFGALGALVIARLPRVAVPVLAVIAVAGFYLPDLVPLFGWPSWILDLSLFHLYGTPLTTGVFWTGLWIMVGVIVIGFGGAMAAMRVREVGR